MARRFARTVQDRLAAVLFWGRRRFLEPTLDPDRDSVVLPVATHSPWKTDPDFAAVAATVSEHTLVDGFRQWELWHLLSQVADVPGDVLEVGVWRGGTGALLAARAKQLGLAARVHLCDTFEGVVKTSEADSHYGGGEHADTDAPLVRRLLERVDAAPVEIHVGIFPEDAPAALSEQAFRFAHIDVDVYESGRDVFDWVWPRMAPGAIVVFDDYGFSTTRGITRLGDELARRDDAVMIQNLNGHAVLVKVRAHEA